MLCAICKKETGATICSERCRAALADAVRKEVAKRTGYKIPLNDKYRRGRRL